MTADLAPCHLCGKPLTELGCVKGAGGEYGHVTIPQRPPGSVDMADVPRLADTMRKYAKAYDHLHSDIADDFRKAADLLSRVGGWEAHIAALQARVDRLTEAAGPFVEIAGQLDADNADQQGFELWIVYTGESAFTAGDLRALAAACKEK